MLASLAVFVPVLLAYQHRALGVPRGDDWSYIRTLFNWAEGDGLSFNNWVSMTLVGQLILALPVTWIRGRDIVALQVGVAIFGYIGILCCVNTARGVGLPRSRAWLLGFVVAVGPIWSVLTVTFMTDVPSFAVASIATALAVRALLSDRPSTRLVILAVAAGTYAFAIRQYAIVPLAAFLPIVLSVLHRDRDPRFKKMLAFVGIIALAAIGFFIYWSQIPDSKHFAPELPSGHSLRTLFYSGAGMLRLLGLWMLPCLLWRGTATIANTTRAVGKGLTALVTIPLGLGLLAVGFNSPRTAFVGNYFVPNGVLADGVVAGQRGDIVPMWFWNVLIVVGTIGAVGLAQAVIPVATAFVKKVKSRDTSIVDPVAAYLCLCITFYAAGYATAAITGLPLYDRYVLPVVPLVGTMLLRKKVVVTIPSLDRIDPEVASSLLVEYARRSRDAIFAAVAVLVLFGLSVHFAADSASFDGARWRVASDAVHLGYGPRQIAGSFEWDNYFSPRPGTKSRRTGEPCIRVTVDPKNRRKLKNSIVVRRWYRAPLHTPVPVLALLTQPACEPAFREAVK